MSIQEIFGNFKRFLGEGDTCLAGLIILVALSSFGLGRMSMDATNEPISSDNAARAIIQARNETSLVQPTELEVADTQVSSSEGGYVASKNGTKYHLPWCGSAKQIKEENKIWFKTKAEAEAAGYSPASNCKGI